MIVSLHYRLEMDMWLHIPIIYPILPSLTAVQSVMYLADPV